MNVRITEADTVERPLISKKEKISKYTYLVTEFAPITEWT
jgi:hypothetical protein